MDSVPTLSQETLKAILILFDAASFKLADVTDPKGELSLERHSQLQKAYAELIKYIELSHGGNL